MRHIVTWMNPGRSSRRLPCVFAGDAYGVIADDRAPRLLRCAKRQDVRESRTTHPIGIFRNRDDLLAALAAQGFRELTQAMCDAAAPRAEALERLKGAGLSYVAFALRRPLPGNSYLHERDGL
jgi:hypothetical protein